MKHRHQESETSDRDSVQAPFTTNVQGTGRVDFTYHRASLSVSEQAEARADLESLPLPLLHNLVQVWFKQLQPWCPILQPTRLQASLDSLQAPVSYVDDLVLRSVLALTISFYSQAIGLGYSGRQRLSSYLRAEVLAEAIAQASVSSLQALLIVAVMDYGYDEVPSAWAILSVCRRLCEQLGLFRRLSAQTEYQTAANADVPGSDELDGPLTWVMLALDSGSMLGAAWCDTSASLISRFDSIISLGARDFSDSFRTTTHLATIGLRPIFALSYGPDAEENLAQCDGIYRRLITYTTTQVLPTYILLLDGSIDFDPNAVLTSMLANAAIITLYQKYSLLSNASESMPQQRCLEACHAVINTIRTVSDTDIEFNSPLLCSHIFVAARFVLALRRTTSQPREREYDDLMHGLNMCGRRWPIARRLDIVLRAAVVEIDTFTKNGFNTGMTLPADFWDLTKSATDIGEILKLWVRQFKRTMCMEMLSGPYA